jgi:hypothetical protein
MVGILLNPFACAPITVIDVVTKGVHAAPAEHGALHAKARIMPIGIVVGDLVHVHVIYQLAAKAVFGPAKAHNHITAPCCSPDVGLARG